MSMHARCSNVCMYLHVSVYVCMHKAQRNVNNAPPQILLAVYMHVFMYICSHACIHVLLLLRAIISNEIFQAVYVHSHV